MIPDIERATVTVLQQAGAVHPLLVAWLGRVCGECEYSEPLRVFTADYDRWHAAESIESGYPRLSLMVADGWDTTGEAFENCSRQRGYDEHYVGESPARERFGRTGDCRILALANALVQFRRSGRPAGDAESRIDGGAYGLPTVVTSLAAKLAEYVRALENDWAELCHDLTA